MIRIENLSVAVGDFRLREINLKVEEGEFFVIMGPTGAGKTVLLESVSGLIPLGRGKVLVKNVDVSHLPPEKRGISIMYQDYSLFPHLSVRENIQYGLRYCFAGPPERRNTGLDYLIDVLALRPLLDRAPASLSGGEMQRVSLARALAVDPALILLDEPLSALDPAFRGEVQAEFKKIHRETGATFIMVTHDFTEALHLARRGAVLNRGKIEQVGEIEEIFKKPRTKFVARFVGIQNLFRAEFRGGRAYVNGLELEGGEYLPEGKSYISIRPEEIVLSRQKLSSSMRNILRGRIKRIVNKGFFCEVDVDCGKAVLRALITGGAIEELALGEGMKIYLSFKATAVHAF
jgi:molybdate/tungstate transport system ATP-binding protein